MLGEELLLYWITIQKKFWKIPEFPGIKFCVQKRTLELWFLEVNVHKKVGMLMKLLRNLPPMEVRVILVA